MQMPYFCRDEGNTNYVHLINIQYNWPDLLVQKNEECGGNGKKNSIIGVAESIGRLWFWRISHNVMMLLSEEKLASKEW